MEVYRRPRTAPSANPQALLEAVREAIGDPLRCASNEVRRAGRTGRRQSRRPVLRGDSQRVRDAVYSGTTMILTEATNPSATSTSTMKVPSSLMGSSSSTLRLSIA